MVQTSWCTTGILRILHTDRYVVSDLSHLHAVLFTFTCPVCSVLSSLRLSLCLRGVGCIFYEMAAGRPLFPGSTVEDELHLIFRLLGERTHNHTHPRTHSRPALQLNDSIQSLCDETHTSTPDITTFKHTLTPDVSWCSVSEVLLTCFKNKLQPSELPCLLSTHTHTHTHTRFCMETVRSHGRLPQFSWNPVLLTLTWCVLTVHPGVWIYLGKKTWKGGLSYIQIVFFLTVAQYCMVLTMPRSWVRFPGKAWTD